MPSKMPIQNFLEVESSNFKPILENIFLSNFTNRYAVNKTNIGPIELERKLLGSPDIVDTNSDNLRSAVLIAQNKIALQIIVYFEWWFACVIIFNWYYLI